MYLLYVRRLYVIRTDIKHIRKKIAVAVICITTEKTPFPPTSIIGMGQELVKNPSPCFVFYRGN
jgi:hypothetical protein